MDKGIRSASIIVLCVLLISGCTALQSTYREENITGAISDSDRQGNSPAITQFTVTPSGVTSQPVSTITGRAHGARAHLLQLEVKQRFNNGTWQTAQTHSCDANACALSIQLSRNDGDGLYEYELIAAAQGGANATSEIVSVYYTASRAPIVEAFTMDPSGTTSSQNSYVFVRVTDSNGDLDHIAVQQRVNSTDSWQTLFSQTIHGASSEINTTISRTQGYGLYAYRIQVSDAAGNVGFSDILAVNYTRPEEHCSELFAGTNAIGNNSINLVFIAAGANSLQTENNFSFITLFRDLINGTNDTGYSFDPQLERLYRVEGLNGLEPFASNQNKFNYWYIDLPLYGEGDPCGNISLREGTECVNGSIITHYPDGSSISIPLSTLNLYQVSTLENYCDFPNKYVHIVVNDNAFVPHDGHFAVENYSQSTLPFGLVYEPASQFPIFVHEFTHSFAKVFDEKGGVFTNDIQILGPNCFSIPGTNMTPQSCAQSEQLPWHDLIGNGCGRDGIVDCNITESYYNPNTGSYYFTRDDEWAYEVRDDVDGCGQGCGNFQYDIFRPHMGCNVMSTCDLSDQLQYTGLFTRLGVINERQACRKIRNLTGSGSDYCNSLCLDGCSFGYRCVNGTCVNRSLIQ